MNYYISHLSNSTCYHIFYSAKRSEKEQNPVMFLVIISMEITLLKGHLFLISVNHKRNVVSCRMSLMKHCKYQRLVTLWRMLILIWLVTHQRSRVFQLQTGHLLKARQDLIFSPFRSVFRARDINIIYMLLLYIKMFLIG